MLEYLYAALRSRFGVVFRHNGEFEPVRQKLYKAREEAKDPDLAALGFVKSPTADDEIWVVKK